MAWNGELPTTTVIYGRKTGAPCPRCYAMVIYRHRDPAYNGLPEIPLDDAMLACTNWYGGGCDYEEEIPEATRLLLMGAVGLFDHQVEEPAR